MLTVKITSRLLYNGECESLFYCVNPVQTQRGKLYVPPVAAAVAVLHQNLNDYVGLGVFFSCPTHS